MKKRIKEGAWQALVIYMRVWRKIRRGYIALEHAFIPGAFDGLVASVAAGVLLSTDAGGGLRFLVGFWATFKFFDGIMKGTANIEKWKVDRKPTPLLRAFPFED